MSVTIQDDMNSTFRRCVKEYRRTGRDPNEVLNEIWQSNSGAVEAIFDRYLKPLLSRTDITVLEIGAGIGRYSKHVLPCCSELYLSDYSEYACEFLGEFFDDGNVHVVHTTGEELSVPTEQVDLVFSISTFVHLYLETIHWYFSEFYRVLRVGGDVLINYVSIMEGGYEFLVERLPSNTFEDRTSFRFYHPKTLEKAAVENGFSVVSNITEKGRNGYSYLLLRKER